MSDQHFPTENEGAKPGGNTGSVHGEAPLIRKKEELTPEQYKRQRNNLVLMALLVVLSSHCFLPRGSQRGLAGEYFVRVSSRMLMSSVGMPLVLSDSPGRTPPFLCRTAAPARRCRYNVPMDS